MKTNKKNWKQIEEEHIKNFETWALNQMVTGNMVTWNECAEYSLKLLKPYFQEELHTKAIAEWNEAVRENADKATADMLNGGFKVEYAKPESSWEELRKLTKEIESLTYQIAFCKSKNISSVREECAKDNLSSLYNSKFQDFISKVEKEAYERGRKSVENSSTK